MNPGLPEYVTVITTVPVIFDIINMAAGKAIPSDRHINYLKHERHVNIR
jgi:hypothetical protein